MERNFERWKRQSEQKLDLSKKGSVDSDILLLVSLINSRQEYFTTSSCSGRVLLIDGISESSEVQKQNCVWLFVSHHKCTADELIKGLGRSCGDAVLKFEPFVLHVQCRRLEDAQIMHSVAINSGFRNSGLTVGKTGKIISAIRSTHGLEVPVSRQGTLLVNQDYIHFLSQVANQKMEENLRRINRFYQNLQTALTAADLPEQFPEGLSSPQPQSQDGEKQVYRRRRRRRDQQNQTNCCHSDDKDKSDDENTHRNSCRDNADSSLSELNSCLGLFT